MQDAPAMYLGRLVPKQNFRTFIYAPNGSSKLVESWMEYEKHMATGLWFASALDAADSIAEVDVKVKKHK